ncbi:cyclic GMP-AMP synthase [Anabas testudineus]|uniref:Cyclic GMP-AMP synthase n=1 Tax=Anabas testudineus TaxID=64144 RepID=A0A3Q1HAZ5_ANATE|nr:cyclic GMP-AMP synthase [Anabas testudineus]
MDGKDRNLGLGEKWEKKGKLSPVGGLPEVRRRLNHQNQQPEDECLTPISPELANLIKQRAKELKIRKAARSWAAQVVNDFRENLLKFLKNSTDQPFFQSAEFLSSGSYFENVKIHSPDEFDMMLKLQAPSLLTMTKLDGGLFYRLDLNRPTRSPIQAFLLENQLTISSSKILNAMYELVRKFLKTYTVPDKQFCWKVNRKRPTSPAVTLSLCRIGNNTDELMSVDLVPALMVHDSQGWPQGVRDGPDVDNWLGRKGRQKIKSLPCVFVPKRLKGRKLGEDAKESWRISFSIMEKEMITKHGHTKTCCETYITKCCRKQSLMLLKSLIEALKQRFPKELEDLCSYHGKTAFLHTLSIRFSDNMWTRKQLPQCFLHLLGALEEHARSGDLPHFFVPHCNLFSASVFPRKSLAFLVNALEEQRKEGLPLLKPPALDSPLRAVSFLEETNGKQLNPKPAAQSLQFTNQLVSLVFVAALCICFIFLV